MLRFSLLVIAALVAVAALMAAPRLTAPPTSAAGPPPLVLQPSELPSCHESVAGVGPPSAPPPFPVEVQALPPAPLPGWTPTHPVERDLLLVLDTSGSMRNQGRLDHARRAARALHASLSPDQRLALIAFADHPALVFGWARAADPAVVDAALSGLAEAGETDLHSALSLAADLLERRLDRSRPARVVVLSDGRANRGETSVRAMAALAGSMKDLRADVITIGLGSDHDPEALTQIAAASGGTYTWIERPSDLVEAFQAAAFSEVAAPDSPPARERVR